MSNLYLFSFKFLHNIGFTKTSVRFARHMEQYSRQPLDHSKLYNAVWEFTLNVTSFPLCQGDYGCYFPVLSDDDKFHKSCRDAQAAEDARVQAEEDAYWASLCQMPGCYNDQVKDGYCQSCWDYNFLCGDCGKLESECHGDCYLEKLCKEPGCYEPKVKDDLCQHHWDVENICIGCGNEYNSCSCDDADDYDERDDECLGGCGQPAYACTCAELASWNRYLATPMEERCGPWTA